MRAVNVRRGCGTQSILPAPRVAYPGSNPRAALRGEMTRERSESDRSRRAEDAQWGPCSAILLPVAQCGAGTAVMAPPEEGPVLLVQRAEEHGYVLRLELPRHGGV